MPLDKALTLMKTRCMNKLLLLITIIMLGTTAFAQKSGIYKNGDEQKVFDSGKALFEEKMYAFAYKHFDTLLTKYPEDFYLKYLMGICGIYMSDKHDQSLAFFTEIKVKNPKVADLDYYFALLYHKTYQFDKCIELARQLLKKPNLNPEFKTQLTTVIGNCENAKLLAATPTDAHVDNIGNPPNTDDAEYSPVITSDEETILFTYRGKMSKGGLRNSYNKPDKYGFYYEDVYMSKKVNGKWQQAVSVDNINTETNEAVLAISNDGQQLFIYRASATDGGDIYLSRLEGENFGVPEKLKGEINTPAWEGSITLSGNQKKVIFSSERPGGYGGKDLYEAEKLPDNTWGHIKNLGSNVNTPFDDDAPFIHPDGRSLVFSSKGHNSIGEFDIFLSELDEKDSTWKKPNNVGYPINTPDDDIYYVLSADGKKGYFASAKTGGHGDKDIYVQEPVIFSKNSYLTVVKGKITESLLPYPAEIAVYYAKDKRSYGIFKPNEQSGNYLLSLPSGNDYVISFYHPILGEKIVNLNMGDAKEYTETVANINFGLKDTSNTEQSVTIMYPGTGKTNTTQVVYKRLSRKELKDKYGDAPIKGLKYIVQLGAYHNQKKQSKRKKQPSLIKEKILVQDSLNLVVAEKEFDNWKEAESFLVETKKTGKQDAFLTVFYNGKRYYLKDFVDMGVWITTEQL